MIALVYIQKTILYNREKMRSKNALKFLVCLSFIYAQKQHAYAIE